MALPAWVRVVLRVALTVVVVLAVQTALLLAALLLRLPAAAWGLLMLVGLGVGIWLVWRPRERWYEKEY